LKRKEKLRFKKMQPLLIIQTIVLSMLKIMSCPKRQSRRTRKRRKEGRGSLRRIRRNRRKKSIQKVLTRIA
jgi:hypothetical protein